MICVVYNEKTETDEPGETFVYTDCEVDAEESVAVPQAVDWAEKLVAEKRECLLKKGKKIVADKGRLNGKVRQPWWQLIAKEHTEWYGDYTEIYTWYVVDSCHV